MISYTPNLEDVLLRRCFADIADGFFVDIGAHHPTNASVTRWFYDQGWSGINIEPGEGIAALRLERPRDINLELAVAGAAGEATFWVHTANAGTSTLDSKIPDIVAEKAGDIVALTVQVETLTNILDQHAAGKHIHFLKIDAEGAETEIIGAADWNRFRPEVLVVESSEAYTNLRMPADWHGVLQENDYLFAYFDGINDFWVRKESSGLLTKFEVPVNVLDNYQIFDPETESLRQQVVSLRAALEGTKQHSDLVTAELESLRAQKHAWESSKYSANSVINVLRQKVKLLRR